MVGSGGTESEVLGFALDEGVGRGSWAGALGAVFGVYLLLVLVIVGCLCAASTLQAPGTLPGNGFRSMLWAHRMEGGV